MLKTHTKTTTCYQHRVIENHQYDWMAGEQTLEAGFVLHITKTPNRYEAYRYVLGTGYGIAIPQHKVGVFKIDKRVITTIKETLTETPCAQP